ncbi:hypothetical protein [Arcobacter porcinus]|uniref:Uncharacterized protein n=1 Tax=Arcobacter porcinus TaxID=1935204 RepID=A0A1C0AZG1_9BACT|nr:hypothetical protein [Arcobacter porcinus]OCL92374.1 hypothetical protein AAX27_01152 [Aliarcobacter thereius]OCL82720.1 hypothetical protein AAW29_01108 [Arcobacter porcinus]OCL85188.1 hypothetical protein AAW30_00332 [Arcobacter porcinus]OCL85638.1 hypothetical protein AAX30_01836 [Arcobacter porcinus]OCL92906.1 hypothetical protein AAX28_00446 [Arcobacter porcinus]
MKTIKLQIADSVFDKVFYFLDNLPKNEVKIIEDSSSDDLAFLENEINNGIKSGIFNKSHEDIIKELKQKYV